MRIILLMPGDPKVSRQLLVYSVEGTLQSRIVLNCIELTRTLVADEGIGLKVSSSLVSN